MKKSSGQGSGKKSGLKSIKGGRSMNGASNSTEGGSHNTGYTNGHAEPGNPIPEPPQKIIDLASVRAQRNDDNRRSVERFFLSQMIDVYCEIEGMGDSLAIEIVDVSENGCSFRLPLSKAQLLPRDVTTGRISPIQARIYFSRDSYLRVGFEVVNSAREIATTQGACMRFGCQLDTTYASAEAYQQFVRFMDEFARHSRRDLKNAGAY